MSESNIAMIVHGGAAPFADHLHERARAGCQAATHAGLTVLAGGGSAVDAVIAAVRVLEDDPTFNSCVGAVLTRAGTIELDASIMDGAELRFGAVAAMENLRRPIDLARAVMDDGEHALMCGQGAWEFARERGITPCDSDELMTEEARARLSEIRAQAARGQVPTIKDPGTVGACALDAKGHVAAGTSTGGMSNKRPGRIGDSPLCGCGTYADDRGGAASATGEGERIMRVTLTRSCVTNLCRGYSAANAARMSVRTLQDDVAGEGGIICCDRSGRLGAAHNSPHMPYGAGVWRDGKPVVVAGVALGADDNLMDMLASA